MPVSRNRKKHKARIAAYHHRKDKKRAELLKEFKAEQNAKLDALELERQQMELKELVDEAIAENSPNEEE